MSLLVLFAPALVLIGGTWRVRIALAITTLATWACAAVVEPVLLPDPGDDAGRWLFFWLYLPVVAGVVAGVVATLTAGRRELVASIGARWLGALLSAVVGDAVPASGFWDHAADVAAPAIVASSFAVMVAAVGAKRV